ncbi:MAG: lectin [Rhodospirillaceae bacterium]|nr:lectin [Rhodospirillaceae bacterium]
MITMRVFLAASALSLLAAPAFAQGVPLDQDVKPGEKMSFFITSVGTGDGANLGGLAGADAHCQKLAAAAGFGKATWRAYLSTQAMGNQPAINARDRIGKGPWHNAKGVMVAQDLSHLHGDTLEEARAGNRIMILHSRDEKGNQINSVGTQPLQHDILTGSRTDGRAYTTDPSDHTCKNWTSNKEGSTQVGHSDRTGGPNSSWNSVHPTRDCSQEGLVATGGAGLFYCFATDVK